MGEQISDWTIEQLQASLHNLISSRDAYPDWHIERVLIEQDIATIERVLARRKKDGETVKLRTFKRRLIQFLLWFYPRYCDWHKGDSPVSWDNPEEGGFPSCPNCGLLLHTKDCLRCGGEFLDFSSRGHDDVMASPMVDDSGDLCCSRCYRPEEPDEDESYGQFDDVPEAEAEFFRPIGEVGEGE